MDSELLWRDTRGHLRTDIEMLAWNAGYSSLQSRVVIIVVWFSKAAENVPVVS